MSVGRCCRVLLLTLAVFTVQGLAQTECVYTFIQQPPSSLRCNPWPVILHSHNTLTLRCDIVGPRNDEAPDIQWFRLQPATGAVELQLGGIGPKYTGPVSSADLGELYKRINFTLNVLEASEADTGCYWCVIRTEFANCSFEMRKSSLFCLQEESSYLQQPNCSRQPTNYSIVCAANATCDERGFPVLFESTVSTTEMPQTMASSVAAGTSLSSQAKSTQTTAVPTLHVQSTSASERVLLTSTPQSQTVQLVATSIQTQRHMLPTPSPSQQPPEGTKQPPDTTTTIRCGLYAGAAVCALLLVVIVMLLVSVIVLCSRRAPQDGSSTAQRSRHGGGVPPASDNIWHEQGPTSSLVTSESSLHLMAADSSEPPPPIPARYQQDTPQSDLQPEVGDGDSKSCRPPSHTLPLPAAPRTKLPARSNTIAVMEAPQVTGSRLHTKHHRLSLQTPEHRSHDLASLDSPEPHYYHILEQHEYYNWWAESRRLEQQTWTPPLHRKATAKHSDRDYEDMSPIIASEGSSCYHWEVQPARRGSKQSLRRVNPYKRLEAATMEPSREYAKVSITSNSDHS